MSGFISPKWAVKLSMDSRIFSESNCGVWCLIGLAVWDWPFGTDLYNRIVYKICSQKRKMTENIFMAQPSLFFPYFDFTLMNVYMNTGIK